MKHNGPPHFQLVIDYWGTSRNTPINQVPLLITNNGHLTFQCVNYYWAYMHVVATHELVATHLSLKNKKAEKQENS